MFGGQNLDCVLDLCNFSLQSADLCLGIVPFKWDALLFTLGKRLKALNEVFCVDEAVPQIVAHILNVNLTLELVNFRLNLLKLLLLLLTNLSECLGVNSELIYNLVSVL